MARYTELSDDELAGAAALFGVTVRDSAHIDGGAANTSYRVDGADGSRFVLTVMDNTVNLPAPTLARLLSHLDTHGVAVPAPLVSSRATLVETVKGRPFVVKPFLAGDCHDVLPLEHLGAAGAMLARIHTVEAPDWLPAGSGRLPDVSGTLAIFADEEFATWVADGLHDTRTLFDLRGPHGIVHGDYFADNLVVGPDGTIAVLDWETASRDTVLVDLGFALVGLATTQGVFDPQRMRAVVDGYRRERELTVDELKHLRDAVIYAATYVGFRRYERHHLRYPDEAKHDLYREMPTLVDSVRETWPDGMV